MPTCAAVSAALVERALAGELQPWEQRYAGLVALVLLLDQFTRNLFRGTPRAFAGDPRALALARETIATDRHHRLPAIHQVFLYLPLEHCEDLAVQDECVRPVRGTGSGTPAARQSPISPATPWPTGR